jgi:hypothetical protein
MSESGVYSSDISQLRHLGSLVDSVLIGATQPPDNTFRAACDALGKALDLARTRPVCDMQGLVFSELLADYLREAADAVDAVRSDLTHYEIGQRTNALLERLAIALERERATVINRIRPPR